MLREEESNSELPIKKIVLLTTAAVYVAILMSVIPFVFVLEKRWDDRYVNKAEIYTVTQADERFANKADVIPRAEALEIKRAAEVTAIRVAANTIKLDYLVKTAAQTNVNSLRNEVLYLENNRKNTQEWQERYVVSKAALEAAMEYRDCLREDNYNCIGFR